MDNIRLERDGVRGVLHQSDRAGDHGLVLTHGAGSNCDSPLLVETAAAFAAAGLSVLRCDLPFRQRRPVGPPSPASSAAADRAGLHFCHYNFVRMHKTIRMTPAMAAGVENRLWSIEELVEQTSR